jgi:ATP-dependent RNA helicase DeaD
MDNIENMDVDHAEIAPYMNIIHQKLGWLDRDELLKRFVSTEFNRFLEYYKNDNDLNVANNDYNEKRGNRRNGSKKFARLHINVGSKQNLKVPNLIGMVNEYTRNRDIQIGKVDILKNFSFFEVDESFEAEVLSSMNDVSFGSKRIIVERSKPENIHGTAQTKKTKSKSKKSKTKKKKSVVTG